MKRLNYFLLIIFSVLFLIPLKTNASIIFPALPIDESNSYMITTQDWGVNSGIRYVYVTYCKNADEVLMPKNTNSQEFGYCYNTSNSSQSYAYRRGFSYNDSNITWQDILDGNADFSSYTWGTEYQGNVYGTPLSYYTIDGKSRPARYYEIDSSQLSIFLQVILYNNSNIYQFHDLNDILVEKMGSTEPTYSTTSTILENGNVELTFTFNDYNENTNYGFSISNEISGQYYGITNPFDDIFPDIIPYGTTYSIVVPYNTYIYVTLAEYNLIEDTNLYSREELYTDTIDINNIVYENPQDPYFTLLTQSKNRITGRFQNTKSSHTCYYIFSGIEEGEQVDCDQHIALNFSFNGYIEFFIKNSSNTIIYDRKINVLGDADNYPYITYEIVKQDFYSVINWSVINKSYDNNMTFRYSTNNGQTYTQWTSFTDTPVINVFDNATVIIDIANSDQTEFYDSKSINVVNSVTNIKNINNTTSNFVDKLNDLFNINSSIKESVTNYWQLIKTSKLYLLIFIPFLVAIISSIIFLIRRK